MIDRLSDSLVSPKDDFGEAGAPEPVELIRKALDDAFREWLSGNYSVLEMGGVGDVCDLLVKLMAARAKAFNSSSDIPRAV
jgi:hypothetical protein